jgi:hypothetical protein
MAGACYRLPAIFYFAYYDEWGGKKLMSWNSFWN